MNGHAWLIKCEGGREFVAYTETECEAIALWKAHTPPGEKMISIAPYVAGPTVVTDKRKAPGA